MPDHIHVPILLGVGRFDAGHSVLHTRMPMVLPSFSSLRPMNLAIAGTPLRRTARAVDDLAAPSRLWISSVLTPSAIGTRKLSPTSIRANEYFSRQCFRSGTGTFF